ncbi:hypothetical protein LAV84_23160 [Rhizobium sp. VS19-DR104.2]|uniref:VPA1262 family N-terminal domain-containing protein n=1 Tax=unclassified Rhizobium TaxID=2613769 RepID=UPI001C5BD187|nr:MULTISPECIES: VPA1262 family N-terminal domain-containing protein [unclassified Rhizobium]MBZ5762073.1 hypothetical protein [Rhizobium sp. VS19-DR96]MBZ5768186.1 hypothetical protein [Rhizobium sp. VS19-DR129.2]MBZ5775749.1 hypothetical protein [Rhizobium sp. VS19-DRK62.2]MBZ5786950.1 hypothetical protein [Rhizobium sp. VS19-DR121]MBZ5804111.1 hypothetical protein [Rhizobium sp. VS19-DR181]
MNVDTNVSATTFQTIRDRLRTLISPGNVGCFDHVELLEIFGTPPKARPINIFSIAVLSEGNPHLKPLEPTGLVSLSSKIDGFAGWRFGLKRSYKPVAALDDALATLQDEGKWVLGGEGLQTGALHPEQPLFVPPDGTARVPLNRVLKNNFWAGSHVLRLCDREKTAHRQFFSDRRRLQSLSTELSKVVPLEIAGLSDLLGDVIIQVPVEIFNPDVSSRRDGQSTKIESKWRNDVQPRSLHVAARTRWDGTLTGASASDLPGNDAQLAANNAKQPIEMEIWDSGSGMLIAATAPTSSIRAVELSFNELRPEPRVFNSPSPNGSITSHRVSLISHRSTLVGEAAESGPEYWLTRRENIEERHRLDQTREFVQYRPTPGSTEERTRALDDVRFLIGKHGVLGVDLWDPYLTAEDLLKTLFWCPFANVSLRGLTDGQDQPADHSVETSPLLVPVAATPSFPDRQRAMIARHGGNLEQLNMEYRTRRGPKGWSFHDRFLIFPNAKHGPLVWSLGTSVNSLGKKHHILQKVLNPELIAGSFEDLWNELDEPQHLIWKSS